MRTFLAAASLGASAAPGDPIKVVYHMNEDVARAEVSRLQVQEGYAYLKP